MVEVLTETHLIKTRKDHICQGCGQKLLKGSECYSTTLANDGQVYTFYECADCRDYYIENCIGCEDFENCSGENYQVGTLKDCKRDKEQ